MLDRAAAWAAEFVFAGLDDAGRLVDGLDRDPHSRRIDASVGKDRFAELSQPFGVEFGSF